MSQKIAILLVAFLSIMQVSVFAQGIVNKVNSVRKLTSVRKGYTATPSIYVVPPPTVDRYQVSAEFVNKTVPVTEIVLQPTPNDVTEPPLPQTHMVEQSTTEQSTTERSISEQDQACVNGVQYDRDLSMVLSREVLRLGQNILNKFLADRGNETDTEVVSPTCIMGALLLPMLGSHDRTYKEFVHLFENKVTRQQSDDSYELHKEFSLLLNDAITTEQYTNLERPSDPWRYTPHKYMNRPLKAINDTTDYKLRIANGIFVHEGFKLRELYKQSVRKGYKTQIKTFDFRNQAEDARQCINNLIKSKTKGKIDQILANPISAQTNLIIVSSLYFNAKWERPFFDRGATRLQNFYPYGLEKQPIQTLMMSTGGLFPYYNDTEEGCQIIGLPYKGNLTTMYVIIPYNSNRERLQEFHKNLTADKVERLISKMELKTTTMVFPKMDIKNTMRLKSILSELGLNKFFNPAESDLSLITDREAEVSEREAPGNCFDTDDDSEDSESGATQENRDEDMKMTTLPSVSTTEQEAQSDGATEAPGSAEEVQAGTIKSSHLTTTTPVAVQEHEETTELPTSTAKIDPCDKPAYKGSMCPKGPVNQSPQLDSDSDRTVWNGHPINYTKYQYTNERSGRRNRRNSCMDADLFGFRELEKLRKEEGLYNPGIYADEIVHKLDLTINEQGTEGGAATAATLHRNAPEVPLRVEVPFIFLIRHDPTRLPIFYGLVYKPTTLSN